MILLTMWWQSCPAVNKRSIIQQRDYKAKGASKASEVKTTNSQLKNSTRWIYIISFWVQNIRDSNRKLRIHCAIQPLILWYTCPNPPKNTNPANWSMVIVLTARSYFILALKLTASMHRPFIATNKSNYCPNSNIGKEEKYIILQEV